MKKEKKEWLIGFLIAVSIFCICLGYDAYLMTSINYYVKEPTYNVAPVLFEENILAEHYPIGIYKERNLTYFEKEGFRVYYPSKWTTYLDDIRFVNCSNVFDLKTGNLDLVNYGGLCKDGSVFGMVWLNDIIIRNNLSNWKFKATLIHELGHVVWNDWINVTYKDRWCDNFRNETEHITHYSYRNCNENFAEAFAVYYIKNKAMEHQIGLLKEIEWVIKDE